MIRSGGHNGDGLLSESFALKSFMSLNLTITKLASARKVTYKTTLVALSTPASNLDT